MSELKLLVYCILTVSTVTVTKPFKFPQINQSKLLIKESCDENTEFKCTSFNKCIKKYQVCDGFNDCQDKSDENHCPWCNVTFNSKETKRFLIKNPNTQKTESFKHCFYKIHNIEKTVTSIRLNKFSVGNYNLITSRCEKSWIKITENDSLDFPLKISTNASNETSNHETSGNFCGSLINFPSRYYSFKQHVTIHFFSTDYENDQFEFEISFHNKKAINMIRKNIALKRNTEFDYGFSSDNLRCDKIFTNCRSKVCAIKSPGYPAIYLKNLKCQYLIQNLKENGKIILINDNLQLDGKICHHTSKFSQSSIFCDSGTRSSYECADTLSFRNENEKSMFIERVCGIGRMTKIVTDRSSLGIDFTSGPNGYFANSGFLFFAIHDDYYLENFDSFNRYESHYTKDEINKIKAIDKLQINNCNSYMLECHININEKILDETNAQSYPFKIGNLYGFNQYHAQNFKLKYSIHTTNYNTIAIYLEKFHPQAYVKHSFTSKCLNNYLLIESKSMLNNTFLKEANSEFYQFEKPSKDRNLVYKICDPSDLGNGGVKSFMIKSDSKLVKKNLDITYFSSNEALGSSELEDFKLSYEFLDFDWKNHQKDSICDFKYSFKSGNSGFIQNPQASIFYRNSPNEKSNFLKCKYQLQARDNQYIKFTFEELDFNLKTCENIYFNSDHKLKQEKCDSLFRKIKIKDSKYVDSKDENNKIDLRMCVCRLNKINQVYVSKSSFIEIEYNVKLDKISQNFEGLGFKIKYEFIDRNCDNLIVQSMNTDQKGKIIYSPATSFGTQNEIHKIVSKSIKVKQNSEYKQYIDMLKANLNFHCKFHLEAPKNHFIYTEFIDFSIGKNCPHNYIKLYSNFSIDRPFDENIPKASLPFISLCNIEKKLSDSKNKFSIHPDKNMITAFFTKEIYVNPTLSCYNSNNKVCFMTNELTNDLNPFSNQQNHPGHFYNELVIEILADNLQDFYYDIKYHFFSINLKSHNEISIPFNKNGNNSQARDLSSNSNAFKSDFILFKCSSALNNLNKTIEIFLDENMVCDSEIDCIYNDFDEFNCPMILTEKMILYLLISVFGFTLCVLLIFCIYRKYLSKIKSALKKESDGSNFSFDNIKYSRGSIDKNMCHFNK